MATHPRCLPALGAAARLYDELCKLQAAAPQQLAPHWQLDADLYEVRLILDHLTDHAADLAAIGV